MMDWPCRSHGYASGRQTRSELSLAPQAFRRLRRRAATGIVSPRPGASALLGLWWLRLLVRGGVGVLVGAGMVGGCGWGG